MLQGNKNKILIITTLCCLLIFMGVGYAIVSTQLNVEGTAQQTGIWNIEITDMKVISKTGIAKEGSFSYEGVTAEFSHELYAPGDSIEYEITVTNKGNIKASLKQITSAVTPEYDDLILTNNLYQGQILDGGESMTFTIKSEFDIRATTLPDEKIAPKYSIEIIYYQYEGNQIVTPPDTSTDNVCFTIYDDGTLGDYDYSCGLDVVVPATVAGKKVTNISYLSFQNSSYMKELGYYKYELYDGIYNATQFATETYYFVESEEALESLLKFFDISNPKDRLANYNFDHYLVGTPEENYMYNSWWYSGINSSGEEVTENVEYIVHWMNDDESGAEYFIITEEEAYDAACIYIESYGYDRSQLYIAGDPDIPYNYRTKLSDVIKEQGINKQVSYIDNLGTVDSAGPVENILSLDLSNALYLETIGVTNLKKLTKLILPEGGSLKLIAANAFINVSLDTVTIPSTVTQIGSNAFRNMPSGSIIKINKKDSTGLTLGTSWNGNATVEYIG